MSIDPKSPQSIAADANSIDPSGRFRQVAWRLHVPLILLAALLVRFYVTFFAGLTWFSTPDSYEYLKMADAIVDGSPYSAFPNGYPLFIAAVKMLFPADCIPAVLVTTNVMLSTLVVWLAMQLSGAVCTTRWAPCATGLLLAVYPNQLNYVRQILTEAPCAFFVVTSLWLLIRSRPIASGFMLVAAVIVRSSLSPMIPLVVMLMMIHSRHWLPAVDILKFMLGLFMAWFAYFALIWTGVIMPSSNLGGNILISITSTSGNTNFNIDHLSDANKRAPFITYLRFASQYPAEFCRQRLLSLNELWGWPSNGKPPRSSMSKMLIALRLPLLVLAIIGLASRRYRSSAWLVFAPILCVTIVHVATFSTPRFTYVAEPSLIILAVAGLEAIFLLHWKPLDDRIIACTP
jgi:hypothetical protein